MGELVYGVTIWGIGALAVMVVLGVAFTRKCLTLSFVMPWLKPKRTKSKDGKTKKVVYATKFAEFYNEVLLYAMPYPFAAAFSFINSEFIFGTIPSYGGKLFFAFLVGTFSGLIVKAVKKSVPGLFGQTVEDDTTVGPPVSG
jgi:hypothetical protein